MPLVDRPFVSEIKLLRDRVPSFDDFPFSLPAFSQLDTLALHPKATFFVGENGTGKSTLIEAIAVAFGLNPEGGSRNFSFATRESHSDLGRYLRLVKGIRKPKDSFFLRAESLFNLATEIERLDREPAFGPKIIESFGGQSLHEQSHGESFFAVFRQRFRGDAFYVLDEPEAALSPMRQLAMLRILHELTRAGAQFIIATHSPILMAYPDALLYELTAEGVSPVDYQVTEHFQTYRDFLRNPDKMLRILLEEE